MFDETEINVRSRQQISSSHIIIDCRARWILFFLHVFCINIDAPEKHVCVEWNAAICSMWGVTSVCYQWHHWYIKDIALELEQNGVHCTLDIWAPESVAHEIPILQKSSTCWPKAGCGPESLPTGGKCSWLWTITRPKQSMAHLLTVLPQPLEYLDRMSTNLHCASMVPDVYNSPTELSGAWNEETMLYLGAVDNTSICSRWWWKWCRTNAWDK